MKKVAVIILVFVIAILAGVYAPSAENMVKRLQMLNERLAKLKKVQAKAIYRSRGKRDPFVPLVGIASWLQSVEKLTDEERDSLPFLPSLTEIKRLYPFTLTGIVYSQEEKSVAIINDKILKKGDEVDGAKVLDIQVGKVKLLWKKKEIYLSIEGLIERRTK